MTCRDAHKADCKATSAGFSIPPKATSLSIPLHYCYVSLFNLAFVDSCAFHFGSKPRRESYKTIQSTKMKLNLSLTGDTSGMDAPALTVLPSKGVEDEPPIPDLVQSESPALKLDLSDRHLHRNCTVIHNDNVAAEAGWFGPRLSRAEVQQDNDAHPLLTD